MTTPFFVQRSAALGALFALGAAAAAPPVARAQQGGGRGFLFREPLGSLTLRGGYTRSSASSDVFSQVMQDYTLGRGDFGALSGGADVALRVAPRWDLTVGLGLSRSSARSEYRDWVDQDDLPIEQTTTLRRADLTAGTRFYLLPRGRSIGRFAWIPSRYLPFLGAGGGLRYHKFRVEGDFIDFASGDVFADDLRSRGWSPMAYAAAGLEMRLTPYLSLAGEGRYSYARAGMDQDYFEGFDRIDLSGYTATIGVAIRY